MMISIIEFLHVLYKSHINEIMELWKKLKRRMKLHVDFVNIYLMTMISQYLK